MSSLPRFFLGLITLLAALALQFWLVPFGIRADLGFATLVTFAFLFNIQELAIFILFAVFIINWQPGLSLDMIMFAFIPFATFFIQQYLHADLWIGGMAAVVLCLVVLYAVISPAMIVGSFAIFFLDIILCLVAGQVLLRGMENRI